jgi:hypothetical protein
VLVAKLAPQLVLHKALAATHLRTKTAVSAASKWLLLSVQNTAKKRNPLIYIEKSRKESEMNIEERSIQIIYAKSSNSKVADIRIYRYDMHFNF